MPRANAEGFRQIGARIPADQADRIHAYADALGTSVEWVVRRIITEAIPHLVPPEQVTLTRQAPKVQAPAPVPTVTMNATQDGPRPADTVTLCTKCVGSGCTECDGVGTLPGNGQYTDAFAAKAAGWRVCAICGGGSSKVTNPGCGPCGSTGWVR